MSIVNNVENVSMCSGKTPYANLLIISGGPYHSRIWFMLFHTTLAHTTNSSFLEVSGTEMDASIYNGRYQNS